ncbi:multiheme c-type cytochrome [Algibacter aquimarinus]|uniref:Multiheme c-type cytochrome n=1 Tax=Algibacter aquimarinus TaxID=1136748 RepID=A0ABP9HGS0_9FLAO
MMKRFIFFILFIITVFAVYLWQKRPIDRYEYFEKGQKLEHFNGLEFSGSEACISCHEDVYNQHIKSAHYLSSTIPSDSTIKGIHEGISDSFKIGKHHSYSIQKKWNGFFQILKNDSISKIVREDKIDIVIGSGVKGQSYFSWEDDKLFQLQTSYFVPSKQWINSPGYKETIEPKKRPISVSCLECHATFAKMTSRKQTKNEFNKRSIILGIDCERCHGPAAKHVEYQIKFPNDTIGKHILKQNQLSRQQKMDMCALCHSGSKTKKPNTEFRFVLGDTLDNYVVKDFRSFYRSKHKSTVDVHGNQVELLEASKCFKKTASMDCNTCHNAHAKERGNLINFNNKCINCHSSQKINCSLPSTSSEDNASNCIDCHMPISNSNSLKIQDNDSLVQVKVRSHLIKIYETPTDKITQYINNL